MRPPTCTGDARSRPGPTTPTMRSCTGRRASCRTRASTRRRRASSRHRPSATSTTAETEALRRGLVRLHLVYQAVDGGPVGVGVVDLDERVPLVGQRVLGIDRLDGALRLA